MTINEAIARIDDLHPNAYPRSDKVRWLSDLDSLIKTQVIDVHEGAEEVTFEPYTDDTPGTTVLLVGSPYEDVYINFLEAKINYYDNEITRYNNAVMKYNDMFLDYANAYNRTHMPIGRHINFF